MGKSYNTVVVIGNGFDLDFGFKTRYSDFAHSKIWEEMYKVRSAQVHNDSLIHYLDKKKDFDNWFDIEASLLEYVSMRADCTFVNNVDEDQKDYELICKNLIKYLDEELNNYKGQYFYRCAAGQLLQRTSETGFLNTSKLYSFNYTPVGFYASRLDWPNGKLNIDFIHGSVQNSNIILGFETENINSIAHGYSFMIKSNSPQYKSTNILIDLINSRNAIFFGHSLNKIDSGYFKDFFVQRSNNSNKDCMISFVTHDNASRIGILDNLRSMGISIQQLNSNSKLEFILTSNIKNENSNDKLCFEKMLNRSLPYVSL